MVITHLHNLNNTNNYELPDNNLKFEVMNTSIVLPSNSICNKLTNKIKKLIKSIIWSCRH